MIAIRTRAARKRIQRCATELRNMKEAAIGDLTIHWT